MDAAAPLLIALLLAAAVGYAAYRKLRRDAAELPRRLEWRDDGLVTIREATPDEPLKLLGEGAADIGPLALAPGRYRLEYEFAEDAPVRVYLRPDADAAESLLVAAAGVGSVVLKAGSGLRLRVEAEPDAAWALTLRREPPAFA